MQENKLIEHCSPALAGLKRSGTGDGSLSFFMFFLIVQRIL